MPLRKGVFLLECGDDVLSVRRSPLPMSISAAASFIWSRLQTTKNQIRDPALDNYRDRQCLGYNRIMHINQSTISENGVVRPTNVEVDLDRLSENYRAIQRAVAPARVMVILKANAYGHGLVPVAHHLVALGGVYLGVAFLEEGILLREAGISAPILVLGGIIGNQVPLFLQHDLTLTASSVEKLQQINQVAKHVGVRAKVHLKIDTGMERIGVHYYNAPTLLETALQCDCVEVEGIYSHFANADAVDLSSARLQLERFYQVLAFYDQRGFPQPPLRHIANSGAILQLPESHFDMVRAGIVFLWGIPFE